MFRAALPTLTRTVPVRPFRTSITASFRATSSAAQTPRLGGSLAIRYKSTINRSTFAQNPIIDYDELKPITEQPNDDVLLIDVREPEEVAMGSIPSSVNLPMSELQQAMKSDYDPGKFRKKFLFDKPLPDQNIVFYCLRGKRAATAGEIAGENGYHNVRNYLGSWKDWSTREGQSGNADED